MSVQFLYFETASFLCLYIPFERKEKSPACHFSEQAGDSQNVYGKVYYFSMSTSSTSKIKVEKGLILPASCAPYPSS